MLLQTPRHHHILDPESESAILIIETHAKGSVSPPTINCLSRSSLGKITAYPGKILGSGESKLLITRVKPGVMIESMELRSAGDFYLWRYFVIGTGFLLIPITSSRRKLSGDDLRALPWPLLDGFTPENRIDLQDEHLTAVFATSHLPSWIRQIADDQLQWWNKHHVENYFRYMPGRPIGPEFARCIKASPFWTLARWEKELFPDQRNFCMRKSPAAAVAFCLEHIPRVRRPHLLARNPEAALRYGFDRLGDKDIAICVTAAPSMAMAMARGFTCTSRARLLCAVVKHCTRGLPYRPTALQAAIFESIAEATDSWLANFDGSLIAAFEKMDCNLGISPSGEFLIELSKQLPPDKQARLREVVAARI